MHKFEGGNLFSMSLAIILIDRNDILEEDRAHLGSKGYYLWFHACSIQLVFCHYPGNIGKGFFFPK